MKKQTVEMNNIELSKKVNELIDHSNKMKWTPVEFFVVLKATIKHVEEEHGIEVLQMDFRKEKMQ